VNSGVTAPNVTKFIYDIGEFIALLSSPSAFQYFSRVRNANTTNEGRSVKFADFASKIGVVRCLLSDRKMDSGIIKSFRSFTNPQHLVTFGPIICEIMWLMGCISLKSPLLTVWGPGQLPAQKIGKISPVRICAHWFTSFVSKMLEIIAGLVAWPK